MQIKNRMDLKSIGKILDKQNSDVGFSEFVQELFKNYTRTVEEMSQTVKKSTSEYTTQYIDILRHFS